MPKPRKTLDLALGRTKEEPAPANPAIISTNDTAAPTTVAPASATKRKGRAAPKISVYMSDATHRQLREIAHAEYPTKLNDLVLEGLDRVFKDRGRPSIAELDEQA